MQTADLANVLGLCEQLGYPCTSSALQERFQKIRSHPDHALFVAKNFENQVKGFVHIEKELGLLDHARTELRALVVDEECRGAGIGRSLVQSAESWSLKNGLKMIRVRTNISREETHLFYSALGYQKTKTSHLFVKTL